MFLHAFRIDTSLFDAIITSRFRKGAFSVKHEKRMLSAACRYQSVYMSAVFAFSSAVRFFSVLHFFFYRRGLRLFPVWNLT